MVIKIKIFKNDNDLSKTQVFYALNESYAVS